MSAQSGLRDVSDAVIHSRIGVTGLIILIAMLGLSIVALIYVPFDISTRWNDITFWQLNPRLALPIWVKTLTGRNLPETLMLGKKDFAKYEYYVESAGLKYIALEAKIDYPYEDYPSELAATIYVNSSSGMLATLRWIQPNGFEIPLCRIVMDKGVNPIYFGSRKDIKEGLLNTMVSLGINSSSIVLPEIVLFSDLLNSSEKFSSFRLLNGMYRFKIDFVSTDKNASVDAELIVYGEVYGLAGTDDKRRDLFVGIVWGAPVALAFGLAAALITIFIQVLLGSLGAWYGGWLDEVVQRITDIFLVLPFLPLLIVVSIVYRIDIWTLLGVVIALSLFGGNTKIARSMALQIMAESYIEAAISYGASKLRILFLYILPRLFPYTLANIVLSVPGYVFLEASLSLLGLGDPRVPTWGKIISDAFEGGAVVHGLWWWILIPSALIILTAFSFAFIGLALDRVVNPKLREG